MLFKIYLLAFLYLSLVSAFTTKSFSRNARFINKQQQQQQQTSTSLFDVPLELTGQLDPSKKWDVKFIFNGQEKVITVAEDCSILDAGDANFEGVECSCRNGVCTTCAGQVGKGKEIQLISKRKRKKREIKREEKMRERERENVKKQLFNHHLRL